MKPAKPYLKNKLKRRLFNFKTPLLLICTLCAVFSFIYILYKATFSYFLIKQVHIEGDIKFVKREDIKTIAQSNTVGKNLIVLKNEEISSPLLYTFRFLSSIEISKDYPDTLIVKVKEREPIAVVSRKDDPKYHLVDKDGFILGEVNPNDVKLPIVLYNEDVDVKIGSYMPNNQISYYLSFLKAVEDKNLEFKHIGINGNTLEIEDRYNTKIYLSVKKDIVSSINTLSEVVRKYNLENKVLKKIDLRFDNVVIEY